MLQLKDRLLELEPAACSVQVTEDDLATVIQLWTGIPASKIKETELQKVAGLKEMCIRDSPCTGWTRGSSCC